MGRLLIVLATAAGCASGSTATQDTAPTANTAATTSATTEPAPQTTTSAAPTTTSTTTTTTIAPATTIDPIAQITADIERDLNLGEQALLNAAADPDSAELRTEVEKYYGGRSLELVTAILDGLSQDGYVARPNNEVPSSKTLIGPVDLSEGPDQARAQVCRIDSAIVVHPAAGGDVVINDRISRTVGLVRVVRVDGNWRLEGGEIIERSTEVTTCDEL